MFFVIGCLQRTLRFMILYCLNENVLILWHPFDCSQSGDIYMSLLFFGKLGCFCQLKVNYLFLTLHDKCIFAQYALLPWGWRTRTVRRSRAVKSKQRLRHGVHIPVLGCVTALGTSTYTAGRHSFKLTWVQQVNGWRLLLSKDVRMVTIRGVFTWSSVRMDRNGTTTQKMGWRE